MLNCLHPTRTLQLFNEDLGRFCQDSDIQHFSSDTISHIALEFVGFVGRVIRIGSKLAKERQVRLNHINPTLQASSQKGSVGECTTYECNFGVEYWQDLVSDVAAGRRNRRFNCLRYPRFTTVTGFQNSDWCVAHDSKGVDVVA